MKRILNINQMAHTPYLSLYKVVYLNKLGNEKNWIVASRKNYTDFVSHLEKKYLPNSDAVVLAAVHAQSGKLVLIKQFRVPINDYVYELPAGLVEQGEKQEDCVRRELKEETGLELIKIDYENSFSGVYASAGMTEETLDLVFCICSGEISQEHLEEDEDIEAFLLNKEEVQSLLESGVSMDVKAHLICKLYCTLGDKLWIK